MKQISAFTLLEILVALFIFAIIGTAVGVGLRTVLHNKTAITQRAQRLSQWQFTWLQLERDLAQALVLSPVKNKQYALQGDGKQLSFVRTGYQNPFSWQKRSTLQYLQYRMSDQTLWRASSPYLFLQSGKSVLRQQQLLDQVTDWRFYYIASNGQNYEHWPQAQLQAQKPPVRLVAIKILVKDAEFGNLSQVYAVLSHATA